MYKIHCEMSDCGDVIGEGIDHDDAHENAIYENGHYYHDEAGVYTCDNCYQKEMNYGYAEAMKYSRELTDRQLQQDHLDYVDSMLDWADRILDDSRTA